MRPMSHVVRITTYKRMINNVLLLKVSLFWDVFGFYITIHI